jgi:hypothetical protein
MRREKLIEYVRQHFGVGGIEASGGKLLMGSLWHGRSLRALQAGAKFLHSRGDSLGCLVSPI